MAAKKTAAAPKLEPAPAAAPAPTIEQPGAPPAPDEAPAAPPVEQLLEAPPVEVAEPEAAAAPAPDLDDFITGHERGAQAVDLVVTAISHPDAKPRHHNGVYSGFPITTGELLATYSDGSTH